jgi:hypothetical protein
MRDLAGGWLPDRRVIAAIVGDCESIWTDVGPLYV